MCRIFPVWVYWLKLVTPFHSAPTVFTMCLNYANWKSCWQFRIRHAMFTGYNIQESKSINFGRSFGMRTWTSLFDELSDPGKHCQGLPWKYLISLIHVNTTLLKRSDGSAYVNYRFLIGQGRPWPDFEGNCSIRVYTAKEVNNLYKIRGDCSSIA